MKKLLIIDSNSVIHRAFHALPPLKGKDGKHTNAIYGFLTVLFKAIKELKPNYIIACFDEMGPTFRHNLSEKYKANRKKAPDELYEQIPKVKEVVRAFNIPVLSKQGFEGDDVIGTISQEKETENIILSGDLDNLQLVNKNTKVFFLRKGVNDTVIYGEKEVEDKYDGVMAKDLIELKALKGDASDNIPGVMGIGEKTAIDLVKKYKNLEEIYNHIDEIKGSVKDKLEKNKVDAFLSRELAKIKTDVDISWELKEWGDYEKEDVVKKLEEYGFKSLISKIPGKEGMTKGDNFKLF